MNAYEKCVLMKDTVRRLYEDEGRPKGYIARLLGVDRQSLSKVIAGNGFIQCCRERRRIQEFLASYKEFVIARIGDGWTLDRIRAACHVGHAFLGKVIEYDGDIARARQLVYAGDKSPCQVIEGERWRPVLGYPGYEVSDAGRVRSGTGMLRQQENVRNGYLMVGMTAQDGTRRHLRVHVLVAHAFCGGRTDACCTVNHIDGDRCNNRASNLEWTSQGDNNRHAYSVLGRRKAFRRRRGVTIVYKDTYTFRTVAAFARFARISETQAARWVWDEPGKHCIKSYCNDYPKGVGHGAEMHRTQP